MTIYLQLLLIKSDPVVFILIAKGQLVCNFESSLGGNTCQLLLLFINHYIFSERTFRLKVYQIFCAIWYHYCNFKNAKNTHGRMSILVKQQAYITKSNIPRWVFITRRTNVYCVWISDTGSQKHSSHYHNDRLHSVTSGL